MFPNPASDILNITANWGAEGAGFTVEMYDFFGRKVYSFDSNAKGEWSHKTNVTGLVSGLYEVRLISQKQVFVRKVIISR